MSNTDLLVVWPKHVDYPWFRFILKEYRYYFNEVYIALIPGAPERDLSEWLRNTMERVTFVTPQQKRSDWRDNAVVGLLEKSSSERVMFLEQDYLFVPLLLEFMVNTSLPFLGFKEGDRIHPACCSIKRKYIEKTSKDFAAHPPKCDHFGIFFEELSQITDMRFITDFGFKSKEHFYHLNGLTQNYVCHRDNQPFYAPHDFLTYNECLIHLNAPKNADFNKVVIDIQEKHGGNDIQYIKNFFP